MYLIRFFSCDLLLPGNRIGASYRGLDGSSLCAKPLFSRSNLSYYNFTSNNLNWLMCDNTQGSLILFWQFLVGFLVAGKVI